MDGIPPHQWKGIAWSDDKGLPPRYGIVTSNMSESMNNMFRQARDGSWLRSLDTMLGTMLERISVLRKETEGKSGIIKNVLSRLRGQWENCAGFKVMEIKKGRSEFTIIRQSRKARDNSNRYTIDIVEQQCECGIWQEHDFPCIDALAYFRLEKKYTLNHVLAKFVDKVYTYEHENELLKENIVPVCMETISRDGVTMAPKETFKRSTGRPRKERIRKRSRSVYPTKESTIVCSRCLQ